MDRNSVIKVKKRLNVTDLAGEKVMVDFEQGKYFMIKGAGNDIWNLLEDGITVGQIVEALLKEYEVTEETCEREVIAFLSSLERIRMIEVD